MSDLTATNCGCTSTTNRCGNGIFGGNNCIWIILLLLFCGGNGCGNDSCGCGAGLFGGGDNNNCCEWIIWILLISCFCGNGCGSC